MQAVDLSFVLFMCLFTSGNTEICKLSPSTSSNTRRLPEGKNIFLPGEQVEIECSEGHRTITKKQRDSFLCGEDGEWPNRITPGCEEIHCSRREHDGHATLHWNYYKYTYRFNEAVTYSCGWGYTKTAEKATCKIDGWSPKQLCVDNNACATPTIENGFVVEHDRNTVGFSCNSGFKLNTGGWWRTSSCSEGVWSVTPKCIEDSNGCAAPPHVPNAVVVSQYQEFYENGIELKYTCRLSYKMEGDNKIICNAGKWTTPPTCLPEMPCDAPTIADNVNYPLKKETYLHGEFLQFECDPGYTSAHQHIKCQNGTWENPFCIRDHNLCTAPPRVENGNIIPPDQKIYSEGFEVKYTCERFYQFNGVDKIACRLGRWTDSPECIPRETCDRPEGQHMTLIPDENEYNNGVTVRYTCKDPFTAIPGKDIRCESGRWSAKVDCRVPPYYCVPPPPESLIDVVGESQPAYPHGIRVVFKCPLYYRLSSRHQTHETMENQCHGGQWYYPMKCLKPCKLNPQVMAERKLEFAVSGFTTEYVPHGDHITFKCQRRTRRVSDLDMRQYCYDGKMDLPECQ
ncbi:hypothetical protein ACEWY4_015062 [Coilia grayii]|uniref:Sushi domain-containing protein n=1 Tax=Coilia grayii TaxID=363190 RepID=A0ABD1JU33_9TELE